MACNTAFSVSCVNTVSVLSLAQTSENTLREFPLVIAAVAKVSRKRGLWLVVRVNKKEHPAVSTQCTGRRMFFYFFLSVFSFISFPFFASVPLFSFGSGIARTVWITLFSTFMIFKR